MTAVSHGANNDWPNILKRDARMHTRYQRSTGNQAFHAAASMLLLCVSAFSTMGCSSVRQWQDNDYKVGPNYCPQSASLQVEWIDMQSDPQLSTTAPDIASWWNFFNDPTLDALIETAYSKNLTLMQAGTRIQQAQAIRGIAEGNLFPQVQQAVGDYQRIGTSRNLANSPPNSDFDQFNLGAKAAWELDFWGRFRRSVEAADANLDASIASYDDVAVILLSSVAATYIEIRTLQQRIALTQANVDSQKSSLKLAEVRFEAKKTNKLDVLQGQNNISITEAAIPALEAQLRVANNRLCVLLGSPPEDLLPTLGRSALPTARHVVNLGIPTDLLRRRPDIRRNERLMKAQSERIGIATADLYPRISLVGSFEWQGEEFSDLFDADSVFSLIGPSVGWKILNYGRIRNSIEREQARFCETVYAYRQNVLTAQQEVEDAIIGYVKAKERTDTLRRAVEEVDEATEIATALYRTGATDFDRVYLLQSVQFAQQDRLVSSQASEALNLIQLYRALGGGWQIRCGQRSATLPMMYSGQLDDAVPPEPEPNPNEANSEKDGQSGGEPHGLEEKGDGSQKPRGDGKAGSLNAVQPEKSNQTIEDALKAIQDAVDDVESKKK